MLGISGEKCAQFIELELIWSCEIKTAKSVFHYSLPLLPKTLAVEAVPGPSLKKYRTETTSIRNKIQTKVYGSSTLPNNHSTTLERFRYVEATWRWNENDGIGQCEGQQ